MNRLLALGFVIAWLATAASGTAVRVAAQDEIPPDTEQVELIEVIDGDTFDVDFDLGSGTDQDRIRMIGIDTPETSYSFGNEPECYGSEATKRTTDLLSSAIEIYLERDEDPVDDNDRLLRYVWYVNGDDGNVYLLNEQLVLEGYAEAKDYPPNLARQNRLDAAEQIARQEGNGLWGACNGSAASSSSNQPSSQSSQSEPADEIPSDAVEVDFVHSIDGDTIDVDYDLGPGEDPDRIRLIGIDTPETNYSFGNRPECYGEEASSRTESLLVAAEEVWVIRDEDPVDNNDRLLRYVWYVSGIDGEVHFLNEQLVEEGFALAKTYPPNEKYQDVLDAAEIRAIEEGRGMWTACDASVSLDPDREQDGEPDTERADPSEIDLSDEDIACSFFDFQDEAQEYLDELPEFEAQLDPDGNGIACDGYFD